MTTGEGGWSEYWEQDGTQGEVFVSIKGKRHPALAEHWRAFFADIDADSSVLDIASGAGSIFASLPDEHGFDLYASDIAAAALELLSGRITDVTTVVSSADSLPFGDATFDVVVSQFGIEYAGIDAFAEAARVVASGGRLAVLAHIRDGYIDASNKAQLAEAILARDSGFIARAVELTRAAFGNDPARLAREEEAFVSLIQALGQAVIRCKRGVHSHLLGGFRRLYENRRHYDAADIVQWLEGMDDEVARAIDRLSRMRNAALSEEDIRTVQGDLQNFGLNDVQAEPFMAGHKRPVAWDIGARRTI